MHSGLMSKAPAFKLAAGCPISAEHLVHDTVEPIHMCLKIGKGSSVASSASSFCAHRNSKQKRTICDKYRLHAGHALHLSANFRQSHHTLRAHIARQAPHHATLLTLKRNVELGGNVGMLQQPIEACLNS